MQHQLAGGFEPGFHLRKPEADGLMADDRFAKRRALIGILDGVVQRRPGHTH